jgi:Tfp pilus assembly protein PilN
VIKINLLEETRQQVKSKGGGGGGGGGPKLQLAGSVGVIVLLTGMGIAAVAVALWFLALKSTLSKLDEDIRAAEAEKARLEYVIKKNEELQAKKLDLSRKIGIIADLKKKQGVPVRLMDLVSRNLVDFVWLEELTYTGELVTMRGKALTPIALANFLRSLEESEYFADVAPQNQRNVDTGTTEFSLTVTFRPDGKATVSPSGASAPPPA